MGKDNNHKVQGYCWPNPEQSLISGVAPAPGTVGIHKASAVALPEMQDTLLLLLGAKRWQQSLIWTLLCILILVYKYFSHM